MAEPNLRDLERRIRRAELGLISLWNLSEAGRAYRSGRPLVDPRLAAPAADLLAVMQELAAER